MDEERVVEQVLGIFALNGVEYMTHENKRLFLVPNGSARVFVDVHELSDQPVVSMRAFLLEQVDISGDRRQEILEELNQRNLELSFGKLYCNFETQTIIVEYDLFATDLQAVELMAALGLIISMADGLDDELSQKLGTGVKALDAWNAAKGNATETAGTGPVVSV